jgi:hypothetical protein
MRHLGRIAVALAAGCAMATGPAAPAPANPSPGPGAGPSARAKTATGDAAAFAEKRQALLDRIDKRLADLTAVESVIAAAKQLTDAHRSALTALVTTARTGLGTLRSTVAAETTPAGLKAATGQMVNSFRVYTLANPQVHLTIATDLETAAAAALTTLAGHLEQAIATARQSGRDTSGSEAKLADLRSKVEHASAAIAGKADALLALRPGPDTAAIKTQVTAVRDAAKTARTDLKAAHAAAQAVRAALRT